MGKLSAQWLLKFFLLQIVLLLVSCDHFQTSARAYNFSTLDLHGFFATDQLELQDISDFYKRVFGGADDDYWQRWDQVSTITQGSVIPERVPYLDSWYPERQQGTNVNGALNKYDEAFHKGVQTAALWEIENNSRQEPSWYGHCNGTSVAASRYQNPLKTVLRPVGCNQSQGECVSFTPTDIRALLTEINMNAKSKFVSGNRCKLSQEELDARPDIPIDPKKMDDCDDVNPASFHVALVNFLGRKKQPLIMDLNRDVQVWNYPIYGYSYTAEGPLNEDQAIARLGLPIDTWIFNDNAESWQFVTMTLSYRQASTNFSNAGSKPPAVMRVYSYLLSLDKDGSIVGGQWVGNSRNDHPDFLWMAFEPAMPTGSASRGNPHVSNQEVISIWAESVGLDPENPFRDKPSNPYDIRFFPKQDLNWGLVAGYYRLILDGASTGSLFTGKKAHLRILANTTIPTGAEVDVLLNGTSLGKQVFKSSSVDYIFDSPRGVNYLILRWAADTVPSEELNWEFRYYAM